MEIYHSDRLPLLRPLRYGNTPVTATAAAGTAATAAAGRIVPHELPGLNWCIHPMAGDRQHPRQHPRPYLAAPMAAASPLPLAAPTPISASTPSSLAGSMHRVAASHTSPIIQYNSGFSLGNNNDNAREDNGGSSSNGGNKNSITNVPQLIPAVAGTTAGSQQFHMGTSLPLPHVAATVGRVGAEVGAGVMAASVGAMGVAAMSVTHQQHVQEHQKHQFQHYQEQEQDPHQQQLPRLNTLSHRCPLCDKCFKRKSWLRRHLLSHSPERHFGCPWCLSKHKRKDNLLQHMKLKHTQYVLKELRDQNVEIDGEVRNDNIKTLLYEGRLNKDDVKKVLNGLIDRHNG